VAVGGMNMVHVALEVVGTREHSRQEHSLADIAGLQCYGDK